MKNSTGTRNRFGSVALTSLLEGFIPWFWAPKPDPQGKTKILVPFHFNASPTIYLSKRKIIIHGLERSGTGFFSEMLRRNVFFSDVYSEFKHLPFDKSRFCTGECYYVGNNLTKYIIVTRDPYSWVISYKNYFSNRASDPTVNVRLTYNHCASEDLFCYIKTWNNVYNKWLIEIPKYYDYTIVRYEDLLEYPEQTLTLLCSRLDLDRFESFQNVNEYVNNYSGHYTPDGTFSRKDYYLKKQYMDTFSPETLATINKCLDKELMHKLGYSLET